MYIVLCSAHAHNNFPVGCYCDSRFIRSNFPKLHPALFFGTNLPGKQFRGRTQTGIVFRARCAGERARRAIKIHYRHARVPAARTFPFVFLTLTFLYTPSPWWRYGVHSTLFHLKTQRIISCALCCFTPVAETGKRFVSGLNKITHAPNNKYKTSFQLLYFT